EGDVCRRHRVLVVDAVVTGAAGRARGGRLVAAAGLSQPAQRALPDLRADTEPLPGLAPQVGQRDVEHAPGQGRRSVHLDVAAVAEPVRVQPGLRVELDTPVDGDARLGVLTGLGEAV